MTEKRYILSHNGKEDGIRDKTNDKGYYGFELARLVNELSEENEQLKKEKDYWKSNSCHYSNYLSILSMDCQIVQEAIWDLKKAIYELDDKFDELNQHRLRIGYTDTDKRYCKNCKYLNKNYDCPKYEEKK